VQRVAERQFGISTLPLAAIARKVSCRVRMGSLRAG